MAGYRTFEQIRPILSSGPPPMPVVDATLISRPDREPSRDALIERMRERRRAGDSLYEIAKDCGVCHSTVRRHTRDIGPPPGGWKTGGRSCGLNVAFAQRLRRAGFTFKEIGEEIGCCESRAHSLIRGARSNNSGPKTRTRATVAAVQGATGVTFSDLRKRREGEARRRGDHIVHARAILFWTLSRRHNVSYAEIGRSLGGFDHTTIRSACLKIDAFLARHPIVTHRHDGRVAGQIWRLLQSNPARRA